MFLQGGNVVYEWSVFRFTDIGLSVAISYAFRVGACMVASLSWLMTTSQSDLIQGLSDVGVPYQFSFGIMLALRYAPLLLGEIGRVREAQKSRAFNWNRGSLKRRFQAFGENARVLVVPVFNRMLTSVNQIALCLDSKGCDFSKPPKRRELHLTKSDKAFLVITLAVTVFFVGLRVMGYGWITMLA
jgi:energy-coupling factor transport system permease protein